MEKIKSLNDLKSLKKSLKHSEEKKDSRQKTVIIKVATATCGIASGAKPVLDFFAEELEKRSIDAVVIPTGCMGYCYAEPTVEVKLPDEPPITFGYVTIEKADEIIERYIKNGVLVDGIIPATFQSVEIKD